MQFRMERTKFWVQTSNFLATPSLPPQTQPPFYPLPNCSCPTCLAMTKGPVRAAPPSNPDSGFVSPVQIFAEQQRMLMLERSCIQTLVDLQQRKKVIGSLLPTEPMQPLGQPLAQPLVQPFVQPLAQPPAYFPNRVPPNGSSSRRLIDLARSRALRQTLIEIDPRAVACPTQQPPVQTSPVLRNMLRSPRNLAQQKVQTVPLARNMKPPKQLLRKFLLARKAPTNSLARTFENPEIVCHLDDQQRTAVEHSGAEVSLSGELKRLAEMVAKRNLAMRTL